MFQRKTTLAILCGACMAAGLFVSYDALAGYKLSSEVTFSSDLFSGMFTTAYNSSDSSQYISCYVQANASDTKYGGCTAYNRSGASRSCVTSDPVLVDIIQSINSDARITVRYNSSGNCTWVNYTNASYVPTKAH